MKLEASNIGFSYDAGFSVDGLSFSAEGGELIGLVGPNGAGKSTLLKMLAGLIKPSSGKVLLDGTDLGQMSEQLIAKSVAYLPQQRRAHWAVSVRRVVELGRLPHQGRFSGMSADDHRLVDEAISLMDLEHYRDRPVSMLSGGEQARVFVARALAQDTQIILADEPVAGLDPGHQLALFEVFRNLALSGHIIIVALHDLSLAARFCNRVLVMKSGKLRGFGPPEQVLNEDMLADVYGIRAICREIGDIPVILPVGDILDRS